jgi:hypothetical protein
MRGLGRIFRRGTVWWVAYSQQGQEYRESARSEKEADAKRLLQQRLGEVGADRLISRRLVFDDLVAEYLQDHAFRGKRSLEWAEDRVANLQRFLGGVKVAEMTTGRLKSYQQARLEAGAAAATINRDLGALGRMFTLAVQSGRLSRRPHVPKLLGGPGQGWSVIASTWPFGSTSFRTTRMCSTSGIIRGGGRAKSPAWSGGMSRAR